MPTVKFTANLKRFYPELKPLEVRSETIADIIEEINALHNGIKDYIVDEQGKLRKHVHIFIGNEMLQDREKLKDSVGSKDEIYIMQALSGG